MLNLRSGVVALLLAFLSFQIFPQKTAVYTDESVIYREAADLFEKEKYSAAQKKFAEIISSIRNPNDELRVNAEYYHALCALRLFNKDAVYLLNAFLQAHPDSKWLEPAYFQLGNYYYRKKDYPQVVAFFSKVNEFKLTADEKTEFKFKLGYSYMKMGEPSKALTNFSDVLAEESEYLTPALYYHAHLNYEAKNYQTALQGFEKIKNDRNFAEVVPYYIAQIYFLQGRYDDLLTYAIPLLETAKPEKSAEISRLIGESYYHKKEYSTALPYLETYAAQSQVKTISDSYQLGYTYYKTGNYEKAIRYFSPVSGENSRIGQTAQYHIADSYLKLQNKEAARAAFLAASKLKFDEEIREDAMFNYAKLAYELSFNPYHEAITAFKEYLQEFPETERSDEANEFLFYVFLNTKNYAAGLEALDLVRNKDSRLQQAYQYIAFNRAVELMLNKQNDEAYDLLEKSKQFPLDKKITAMAVYWQAEIRYQQAKYQQALNGYYNFQRSPGAYSTGLYDVANYNIGYAHFKLSQYPEAATSFRKFVSKPAGQDDKLVNDAYLRIGDCYFVARQYDLAVGFYDRATAMSRVDPDYGYFQSAMAKGYMNREVDKINSLLALRQQYPNSRFMVDATYELGEAYFKTNEDEKALESLQSLAANYPGSPYARKGMLLTGLIQYRQKKMEEALATFRKIAAEYPTYEDAREAIARAEDIYVELGRVEEYNDWVQNLKFYSVSSTALDSVNFRSAENIYAIGDCEKARSAFEGYLSRFKPAIFDINAHFYLADCYYKAKDFANALEHYTYIISKPVNRYTELSLVAASFINYSNKNYSLALENYRQLEKVAEFKTNVLEAQIGQMRCYAKLGNNVEVLLFADKVLSDDNTPQKIRSEAQITKGRAHFALGDFENARKIFAEVASTTKTIEGAEARYNIAYILFTNGEFNKAEEEIFDLVNMKPVYDTWIARAFVLLSDVYVKTGDLFQAKATLQSVIDNHKGEELVNEAKRKLQIIIDAEKPAQKNEEQPAEIKLEGYDKKYDKLYEDDQKKEVTPIPPRQ